uniref:DDE Tnp4 domain-containing protein n=1 Tax=Brassica oleracea var. oleracea TaxID=109376 RepID=A0A0D3BFG9_BRAOL
MKKGTTFDTRNFIHLFTFRSSQSIPNARNLSSSTITDTTRPFPDYSPKKPSVRDTELVHQIANVIKLRRTEPLRRSLKPYECKFKTDHLVWVLMKIFFEWARSRRDSTLEVDSREYVSDQDISNVGCECQYICSRSRGMLMWASLKRLPMHNVDRLSNDVQYFREKKDGLGRISLSPLQKCTTAIRVLAYSCVGDTVDEYLRLGKYSRGSDKPTIVLEAVASYDLWIWHAFFGPPDTLNDINVLDRSPVFDDIINGQAPNVTYFVNEREYHMAYYLTDGIYLKWATFIQSIPIPQGPKAVLFAQRQETVRKDVERAFGVLQARFAIVKNPALFWDKIKIGKIMRACIILHNMIVEDERDEYTQFDVSEFQQGEDNGSSHVDLTYSTDIPTNIANMMDVRTRICDRQMHQQLKDDLVEHI